MSYFVSALKILFFHHYTLLFGKVYLMAQAYLEAENFALHSKYFSLHLAFKFIIVWSAAAAAADRGEGSQNPHPSHVLLLP